MAEDDSSASVEHSQVPSWENELRVKWRGRPKHRDAGREKAVHPS